jgi:hypothetical protein
MKYFRQAFLPLNGESESNTFHLCNINASTLVALCPNSAYNIYAGYLLMANELILIRGGDVGDQHGIKPALHPPSSSS